jgi:hypothetical protein
MTDRPIESRLSAHINRYLGKVKENNYLCDVEYEDMHEIGIVKNIGLLKVSFYNINNENIVIERLPECVSESVKYMNSFAQMTNEQDEQMIIIVHPKEHDKNYAYLLYCKKSNAEYVENMMKKLLL